MVQAILLHHHDLSHAIIGSCFVHPRETHISLGIMNVHHDHFGRGVARALLTAITDLGKEKNLPVRLVSSCFNLDSYSLYTKAGFVPRLLFQTMLVPDTSKMSDSPPPGAEFVRDGCPEDAKRLADLE